MTLMRSCNQAISFLAGVRWRWALVVVGAAVAGLIGLSTLALLRAPQTTAAQRGREISERLGCFGCHGPEGAGGVPNPGAAEGEVPPLRLASTLTSYVQRDAELAEWVRDGRPARLADNKPPLSGGTPLLRMPAYRDHLDDDELDDVVAYLRQIGGYQQPADPAIVAGRELARAQGCFGCHGEDGRGALANPGSFKGIIPPWDSDDFEHLVESDVELRQWILDGNIARFRGSKLATFFLERQAIKMPGYRDRLTTKQVDQLIAFINWVRKPTRQRGWQERWVVAGPVMATNTVDRGRRLYQSTGCAACHGVAGRGGVSNGRDEVPSLDDLADKMELFEADDIAGFVAAVNAGVSLKDARSGVAVADWTRVRDLYLKYRDLIAKGGQAVGSDEKAPPPMPMPAWRYRVHADATDDLEHADIDAILAYLVNLSPTSGATP